MTWIPKPARFAKSLGIRMARPATVGVHPRFVSMIRDLMLERTEGAPRLALGDHGPSHDDVPRGLLPQMKPINPGCLLLGPPRLYAQQPPLDFLNHGRSVLDAHNCYPYKGSGAIVSIAPLRSASRSASNRI